MRGGAATAGPAPSLGGRRGATRDRLILDISDEPEPRILRLACSVLRPCPPGGEARACDRLGRALAAFITHTTAATGLPRGGVTMRRSPHCQEGQLRATLVVADPALFPHLVGLVEGDLLMLPAPYGGAIAAHWVDTDSDIHVRGVGVPLKMTAPMMQRLLTQSGYSVRSCSNEAGQWGQLRNEALSIVFQGGQRPPKQMTVTVGRGLSAVVRFDIITTGVLPYMPPEALPPPPVAAPLGDLDGRGTVGLSVPESTVEEVPASAEGPIVHLARGTRAVQTAAAVRAQVSVAEAPAVPAPVQGTSPPQGLAQTSCPTSPGPEAAGVGPVDTVTAAATKRSQAHPPGQWAPPVDGAEAAVPHKPVGKRVSQRTRKPRTPNG